MLLQAGCTIIVTEGAPTNGRLHLRFRNYSVTLVRLWDRVIFFAFQQRNYSHLSLLLRTRAMIATTSVQNKYSSSCVTISPPPFAMISVPCETGDIPCGYDICCADDIRFAYEGTDIISCLRSKYIMRRQPYIILHKRYIMISHLSKKIPAKARRLCRDFSCFMKWVTARCCRLPEP